MLTTGYCDSWRYDGPKGGCRSAPPKVRARDREDTAEAKRSRKCARPLNNDRKSTVLSPSEARLHLSNPVTRLRGTVRPTARGSAQAARLTAVGGRAQFEPIMPRYAFWPQRIPCTSARSVSDGRGQAARKLAEDDEMRVGTRKLAGALISGVRRSAGRPAHCQSQSQRLMGSNAACTTISVGSSKPPKKSGARIFFPSCR